MPFLYLAVAGRADAVVAGATDLLTVSRVGTCPIMTVEAFLSAHAPRVPPE